MRRGAWERSGNGTYSGILVAAANGGRTTDFGGCPAGRTGAERNRNSSSTAAPPQESTCKTLALQKRMAEAFVTAISAALTSNTYGIAGACTPSNGGVVFTNAKKQARLVPAPEFARLAAAYGTRRPSSRRMRWSSAPAALTLEVPPTFLVDGTTLRKIAPAALDPVQDKAETIDAAAGRRITVLRAPWRGRLDACMMSEWF